MYAFVYVFYKWGNWNQETFYSCLRLHTVAFMQPLGHKNTIWTQPLATLNSLFSNPMSANIHVTLLWWAHPLDRQAFRIFSFMRTSILDTGSRRRWGVGGVKGKGGYWRKAWICLTDSFHKAASDSHDKSYSLKSLSSATAAHNTVITIRGVISKLQRTAQHRKL